MFVIRDRDLDIETIKDLDTICTVEGCRNFSVYRRDILGNISSGNREDICFSIEYSKITKGAFLFGWCEEDWYRDEGYEILSLKKLREALGLDETKYIPPLLK
jgi:hypothetical protein